jgi:hypothetical protein
MPSTDIDSERQPSVREIVSLLKGINESKTKVGKINGAIGERLRDAKKYSNLDIDAAKQVAKEIRTPENRRNDLLRKVEFYRGIAREAGLYGDEHTGDFLDGEAEEVDEAAPALPQPLPGADAQGDYKPLS